MNWFQLHDTRARRYGLAIAVALLAAAGQWLIFPFAQGRIPFLLFVPWIVIVATLAGRGPAVCVFLIGVLNATLQLAPVGSLMVMTFPDRLSLAAYSLVSILLIIFGNRLGAALREQYQDVGALHDLSTTLIAAPGAREQAHLVLKALARLYGAEQGLISTHDPRTIQLQVLASLGFSARALETLKSIPDDAGWFSTPLLNAAGEKLGTLAIQLPHSRRPTTREIRLADICAEKAAAAIERARATDLATRRELRFRTVLEASAVPFTILEPLRQDGHIVDFRWMYVNEAAARAMQRGRDQLLGRPVRAVLPSTWNEPGLLQAYADVIERQEVREIELHSDAIGIAGWFHIVASPIDDMLAVWFADVSQLKRQELALREADRRKDEFIATLAHELRNPLAPIRMAAAAASKNGATESQRAWTYSVIERQVQHMSLLLDDLLEVSRITHGTLSLRKQPLQVKSAVAAAVETARPLIDSRSHQLHIDVPEDLLITADPLRLAQIVGNLLTNAAKYTAPAGIIRVRARADGNTVVVEVEDTGVGLRPEDLAAIFGMFSQVRSAQEFAAGGLGIGLALTKGLVELHGGTIEARSAGPGKGSTFTVRLPLGEQAVRPAPANEERAPVLRVSRRVLIVDDNRDSADSLAMLLEMEGHDVVVGNDGKTALRLCATHRPEIALIDIGMPELTGHDVAQHIRATSEGANVLLIAMTGWGQEKDRQRSRDAGFDHHLTKPLDPGAVSELVRTLKVVEPYTAPAVTLLRP